MNNIDLTPVLEKINFIDRYKKICEDHNDFENRMRTVDLNMVENVLDHFGYEYTYFSKEKFYRIVEERGNYCFILQLIFKDGIVESLLNIKFGDRYYFPNGRFDFIPKKMLKEFDRKKYNLPKYSAVEEFKLILKDIFSIYEDIKRILVETVTP